MGASLVGKGLSSREGSGGNDHAVGYRGKRTTELTPAWLSEGEGR